MDYRRINILLRYNAVVRSRAKHHSQPKLAWLRDSERAEFCISAHCAIGAAPHACCEIPTQANGSSCAGFVAEGGAHDKVLHILGGCPDWVHGNDYWDCEGETGLGGCWGSSLEGQCKFTAGHFHLLDGMVLWGRGVALDHLLIEKSLKLEDLLQSNRGVMGVERSWNCNREG